MNTAATLQTMMAGMKAAEDVRKTGGLPEHIDALAQPESSEVEGVRMWHYPIATYCAMNGIQPWIDPMLERARLAHAAKMAAAHLAGPAVEEPDFEIPVEVMLMQCYAFAEPRLAYQSFRHGEGPYMKAVFDWADKTLLDRADRWVKLGRLYRFVLEQCGVLKSANPRQLAPETPAAESAMPEATAPQPT